MNDIVHVKDKIYSNLPMQVKDILIISQGWLVGGAVISLTEDKDPKDYDIIVEDGELFMRSIQYLTSAGYYMSSNTYGGLKFTCQYHRIDLWVESLSHFLANRRKNNTHPVFNLKHWIYLTTQ